MYKDDRKLLKWDDPLVKICKETSLQLQGIMNIRKQQVKIP